MYVAKFNTKMLVPEFVWLLDMVLLVEYIVLKFQGPYVSTKNHSKSFIRNLFSKSRVISI